METFGMQVILGFSQIARKELAFFMVTTLVITLLLSSFARESFAKGRARANKVKESTPTTSTPERPKTPETPETKSKIGPIDDPNDPNLLELESYERYQAEPGKSSPHPSSSVFGVKPMAVNSLANFEKVVNSAFSAAMERDRSLLKLAKLSGKDELLAGVLFDMFSEGRGRKPVERYIPKIEKVFPKSAELWKVLRLTFEFEGDREAAAACPVYSK